MLSLPLAGRGNVMPLLLEPTGNLAAALAERLILRTRRPGARIEPPPGYLAIDTHVHTSYSAVELRASISRDGGRTFTEVSCDPNISAFAQGAGVVEQAGANPTSEFDDPSCPYELEYEPADADIGHGVHIFVQYKDVANGTTQTGTLHLKVAEEG